VYVGPLETKPTFPIGRMRLRHRGWRDGFDLTTTSEARRRANPDAGEDVVARTGTRVGTPPLGRRLGTRRSAQRSDRHCVRSSGSAKFVLQKTGASRRQPGPHEAALAGNPAATRRAARRRRVSPSSARSPTARVIRIRRCEMYALLDSSRRATERAHLGETGGRQGVLRGTAGTGRSALRERAVLAAQNERRAESILEGELLGYEKGAFTGPRCRRKAGLFESPTAAPCSSTRSVRCDPTQAKLCVCSIAATSMRLGAIKRRR